MWALISKDNEVSLREKKKKKDVEKKRMNCFQSYKSWFDAGLGLAGTRQEHRRTRTPCDHASVPAQLKINVSRAHMDASNLYAHLRENTWQRKCDFSGY